MTHNEPALADLVPRTSLPGAAQRWLDRALPRYHDLPSSIQYDLIVVLTSMPQALEPYGVTYIDGRLTDLIFVTAAQLEAISLLEKAVDGKAWLGRIIRWFERGDIGFDRLGRLVRIQAQVQGRPWIKPLNKPGREAWREVNYNLAQSKRLRESEDPVYLVAADLRLALYGPADLLFNYFHIRNIAWEGEKAAVRYLMAHDPAYLELLREFIRKGERERKFELYGELAALTVAPLGEIWPEGVTVLAVKEQNNSPKEVERALNLWEELLEHGAREGADGQDEGPP